MWPSTGKKDTWKSRTLHCSRQTIPIFQIMHIVVKSLQYCQFVWLQRYHSQGYDPFHTTVTSLLNNHKHIVMNEIPHYEMSDNSSQWTWNDAFHDCKHCYTDALQMYFLESFGLSDVLMPSV